VTDLLTFEVCWFARDDRGHLHPFDKREDAEHAAAKVGHEAWSVVSQEIRYGPLVDRGSPWLRGMLDAPANGGPL
jgi:hypothetical protein